MTDIDIIKNFETSLSKKICLHCPFPNIENCFNCGFGPIISTNFYISVLELINSQKAEIEELQHKIMSCNSEAIEDFAQRLKEIKRNYQLLRVPLLDSIIDNLVKEMKEGKTRCLKRNCTR